MVNKLSFPPGIDLVTLPPSDDAAYQTPRHLLDKASDQGDYSGVIELLETWASTAELTPKDMGNALNSAVFNGHLPVVQLLLDHGAPITTVTNNFATRGNKSNRLEIFKVLLQHGWRADSISGQSALMDRMTMKSIILDDEAETLLPWFLDNGAPTNGIPTDPIPPLRTAAEGGSSLAVTHLLLSHEAALKCTGALHAATRRDDALSIPLMKLLLDEGIDVDEIEYEGWCLLPRHARSSRTDWGTAMHTAALNGSVSKATLLVEHGADLLRKSKHGYTARDRAQICGTRDVELYLEKSMRDRGIEIVDPVLPEENPDEDEIPTWRALD